MGSQETATAIGDRQAGYTLVELMVTLLCVAIITTMVSLMLLSAYRSESRVSAMSQANSQVTQAFTQLDSEIRYASDINVPGQDSSSPPNYFVEFQSNWTESSESYPQCTEVEYDNSTGVLQQQTWLLVNAGTVAPGTWQVIASGLKTDLSTDPFSLSDTTVPWQLAVSISSTSGVGATAETAQSSFAFTALNTTGESSSTGVCGGTP